MRLVAIDTTINALLIVMMTMETIGTFADVLVDSHIDILVSLCEDFDAVRQIGHPANIAVPENTYGVFSLALQNLNAITQS